jgi:protein-tyrosine-phosphatase
MTPLAQLSVDAVQPAFLESEYPRAQRTLRVCHVASGDSWAGADMQLATTAAYLVGRPDVDLTAVLLNEGPLARELRRHGVEVAVVDETRTSALGILRFLIRFLKEHRIDLVHTHRHKDNVLGTLAAKLAGTLHVVRTVHGRSDRPASMSAWNKLERGVYQALDRTASLYFADLIIAVSKRMADTLREAGYRPAKVTHIHDSIDAEEFSRESCGEDLMDAYRSVALTTRPHTDGGRRSGATIGPLDLCRGLAQKVLDRAVRAVSHAVERRRLNRMRRNPVALRRALRGAANVLVMCHGNIIRSPFATQLIRQALVGRSLVSITSAGLGALSGNPAHPTALRAANARSVDLSGHHASAVAPDRVAASDVIFVMDVAQIAAMRERFPDARGKTFLLTCLAPELPLEVADPIDRDEAAYHACYEHISRAVRPIIRALAATPAVPSPTR